MKPSIDLKRKIITNKDAQSIEQIMKETGLSETSVRRHAKRMVDLEIWQEGYKKVSYGFVKVFLKIK